MQSDQYIVQPGRPVALTEPAPLNYNGPIGISMQLFRLFPNCDVARQASAMIIAQAQEIGEYAHEIREHQSTISRLGDMITDLENDVRDLRGPMEDDDDEWEDGYDGYDDYY